MTQVTRPSNMAIAFVNAAIPHLKAQGPKAVWTARKVADNADREVGTLKEFNEINISGTPAREIDRRLTDMGFNLYPERQSSMKLHRRVYRETRSLVNKMMESAPGADYVRG